MDATEQLFYLGSERLHAVRAKMFEYRVTLVRNLTTGAIVGDNFYFIANPGIQKREDGQIVDSSSLESICIAKLHLR